MCNDIKKETVCYVVAYSAKYGNMLKAANQSDLHVLINTSHFEQPLDDANYIAQSIQNVLKMAEDNTGIKSDIIIGVYVENSKSIYTSPDIER